MQNVYFHQNKSLEKLAANQGKIEISAGMSFNHSEF